MSSTARLLRTRYLAAVAAAALALLPVACGGGGSSETGDDASTASDTTTDDTGTDGAVVCPGAPAPGLVEAIGADAPIASNNTTATIELVFSAAVQGVDAAIEVTAADGFAVPTVTVAAAETNLRWNVALDGLAPGGTYTIAGSAAAITAEGIPAGCPNGLAGDVSVALSVGLWDTDAIETEGALPGIRGPLFAEVTDELGLLTNEAEPTNRLANMGRGQIVDVDGDGLDDIVAWPVTQAPFAAKVMRQTVAADGTRSFVDATAELGLSELDATLLVFGDLDNDGDQDLFTGVGPFYPQGKVGVWINTDGVFAYQGNNGILDPALTTIGANTFYKDMTAASLADFDGDGILDLYVGTWYAGSDTSDGSLLPPDDELYKGNGDGTFSSVALPDQHNPISSQSDPGLAGTSRAAYGIAVSDYDNDGDLDIFVNNYGAGRPAAGSPPLFIDHNFLWRNDGDMTFTDVSVELGVSATTRGIGGVEDETPVVLDGTTYPGPIGGNGFGCQWGDLDNDGDMDLAIGTIAHPDYVQSDRTMLHYNQGAGVPFTEESAARGLQYYEDELHPALVDWDNDGRLDFAMSRLRGGSKWELYHQESDQSFLRLQTSVSGVDIQRPGPTVWFDYDDDGDLDFFMPRDGGGRLFRNEFGQQNNALAFDLVGTAPADAAGARVILETSTGTQVREITNGNGHFNTQFSDRLHFGLGKDTGARNVRVVWADGTETALGDVRANVRLRVTQGGETELVR